MKKFVVNKGKAGYDFATLADTETGAKDLAWFQISLTKLDEDVRLQRIVRSGPFQWWEEQAKKWGNDKWWVDEIIITKADKPKTEPLVGKQEHDVIMDAVTGHGGSND